MQLIFQFVVAIQDRIIIAPVTQANKGRQMSDHAGGERRPGWPAALSSQPAHGSGSANPVLENF
jgi:hypothetical protein